MREFNILTPGEKIKKIRDELNIKQEDLAGGEITRNLISIIENNKANLTEATAKVLTKNINSICKERDLNFEVTEEFLLEDVVSQAKKIVDEYIEFINNLPKEEISNIEDKLYEINFFLKSYNTEEKRAELYLIIGSKFKFNSQYLNAFDYYLKAFESTTNKDMTIKALLNMGICDFYLSKYDKAISYFNLLLDMDASLDMKYYAEFNIALCQKKLSKFEEANEIVNSMRDTYKAILADDIGKYIDFNILMAVCFYELQNFNEAIKVLKALLKIEDLDIRDEILIMSELSDIYRKIRDYDKLDKICTKILQRINTYGFNSRYEGEVLLTLATNLKVLNSNNDTIISLLYKALNSFKNGKSHVCLEDVENVFKNLLEAFIYKGDEDNINYLKNELLGLIQRGSVPRGNTITLRFIKYYNSKDLKTEIDSLVDFLIA